MTGADLLLVFEEGIVLRKEILTKNHILQAHEAANCITVDVNLVTLIAVSSMLMSHRLCMDDEHPSVAY